jgi:hypothetical protein
MDLMLFARKHCVALFRSLGDCLGVYNAGKSKEVSRNFTCHICRQTQVQGISCVHPLTLAEYEVLSGTFELIETVP